MSVSTFCPARDPKAMQYVTAAACNSRNVRAFAASALGSDSQVYPMSTTKTLRRVSSFISRAMRVCRRA